MEMFHISYSTVKKQKQRQRVHLPARQSYPRLPESFPKYVLRARYQWDVFSRNQQIFHGFLPSLHKLPYSLCWKYFWRNKRDDDVTISTFQVKACAFLRMTNQLRFSPNMIGQLFAPKLHAGYFILRFEKSRFGRLSNIFHQKPEFNNCGFNQILFEVFQWYVYFCVNVFPSGRQRFLSPPHHQLPFHQFYT